eukprot:EG_transcript_38063
MGGGQGQPQHSHWDQNMATAKYRKKAVLVTCGLADNRWRVDAAVLVARSPRVVKKWSPSVSGEAWTTGFQQLQEKCRRHRMKSGPLKQVRDGTLRPTVQLEPVQMMANR